MTKPRIHVTSDVISHDPDSIQLDKWQSNYLMNVLRLRKGDPVTVFDGEGGEYGAVLFETEEKKAALRIVTRSKAGKNGHVEITCAVAIPKGKKMPLAVQKLTEIGVARIVPVVTKRTVVEVKERGAKKDRWTKIAVEAAKQCGRTVLPEIAEPVALQTFFEACDGGALKLVAHEKTSRSLKEVLERGQAPASVIFLIGPEGGLEASEVKAAEAAGFLPFSFGRTILRCETAAIAAAAILSYEFGS